MMWLNVVGILFLIRFCLVEKQKMGGAIPNVLMILQPEHPSAMNAPGHWR